jgi:hypothetical protein
MSKFGYDMFAQSLAKVVREDLAKTPEEARRATFILMAVRNQGSNVSYDPSPQVASFDEIVMAHHVLPAFINDISFGMVYQAALSSLGKK